MAGFFDRFRKPEPEPVSAELDQAGYEEVLDLIRADRKVPAVKRIRELTGMGLVQAKDLADAIEEGRWAPFPAPGQSLADRVRALLSQDRVADAVRMVAQETGMTEDEASRFIDGLDQP
ncbi:ribosomal protein L7/L12 [Nocardiopsis sp. SBT366]|uniref:ribosomal protein L7/L12 n=1 Tax=Nocardiopsis sp. SBT366 TaxID=1580529 RepID=UPI00066AB018|nr:ribosomal protein L7/L12 [Nocardiopsis sp. SBT366]